MIQYSVYYEDLLALLAINFESHGQSNAILGHTTDAQSVSSFLSEIVKGLADTVFWEVIMPQVCKAVTD